MSKKKTPRECPPPPVPKTSKTKTKTSAVGDWKRGPRVTALVVGHGVSEKAIETILARGYLSRIAVSASDCLSLDNPHFERSSSLALHLPSSTIDKTELCPALVDENFDLGIGPIPSVDFLLRVQVLLSIALSLSPSINMRRARSQTIGRRSPIPYLSPLLDLMAADNWLQVGPGIRLVDPRGTRARSSFTRPNVSKDRPDFLR